MLNSSNCAITTSILMRRLVLKFAIGFLGNLEPVHLSRDINLTYDS